MNKEEFKASHFDSIGELLEAIKLWIKYDYDYGTGQDDFNRFFDYGAMEEMYYYIKDLQQENKQLKEQCEIVEKRLVDEYEDMLDKRNKLFVENCKLKRKLECSQTNEETYRLEMLDITKILGLDEDTLFDDVKKYASKLQHIIDELEKWLEEKLKEMQLIIDDVDISFEVDYERIDEARNCKIAYNTALNKLQELKGSDKE